MSYFTLSCREVFPRNPFTWAHPVMPDFSWCLLSKYRGISFSNFSTRPGTSWPRSHQAHLAEQHVEKLGQLIQACFADKRAE